MNLSSLANAGADPEGSVKETNPFFHADKTEPARSGSGRFVNKSLSIVADTDSHAGGGAEQADEHV